MKTLSYIIISVLLCGCGGNAPSISSSQVGFVEIPQKWRVQCAGGSAQHSVPIFWDFQSFNPRNGAVRILVTDADGFTGINEIYIKDNKITLFGVEGEMNGERTKFFIKDKNCPQGIQGSRVS